MPAQFGCNGILNKNCGDFHVVQIWDVGTGQLKLTLTGHIEQVRGMYIHRVYLPCL